MSEEKKTNIIINSTAWIAEKYKNNPAIRVLLPVVATWVGIKSGTPELGAVAAGSIAALAEILDFTASKIYEKRFFIVMDEISRNPEILKKLTEEIIKSEELIHSLITIARPALNTHPEPKIRRFARILLAAIEKDELASDKFEEYVKILEALSQRELDILSSLQKFEQRFVANTTKQITVSKNPDMDENIIQMWAMEVTHNIWHEYLEYITHKHQISKSILLNQLNRLEGMGLYSGTQLKYQQGSKFDNIGTTTFLFDDFYEWIRLENEKLNADG